MPATWDTAGRAAAGKDDLSGFEMCGMPFIVTGVDEDQLKAADAATRKQIAFYGSMSKPVQSYTEPDLWVMDLAPNAQP